MFTNNDEFRKNLRSFQLNVLLRDKNLCKSHESLPSSAMHKSELSNKYDFTSDEDEKKKILSYKVHPKRNSRSEENLLKLSEDAMNLLKKKFATKMNEDSVNKRGTDIFCDEKALEKRLQEELKITTTDDLDCLRRPRHLSSLEHLTELNNTEDFDEKMMPPLQSPPGGVVTDSQGLIVPKKLINPCLESSDRQNLHRELLFNQKIGRSVLNQKSELQKVLQKQKERQFISTQQQQMKQEQGLSGELGRVIMQRAQRLETLQNNVNNEEEMNKINPEYVNARAKLKATAIDSK